jgi:hypothetical protein
MRVRCKEKCKEYSGELPYWYSPDVGDEIDVVDAVVQHGKLWYDLAGYEEFLYDAEKFEVIRNEPAEVIEETEPAYATA